MIACIRLRLRHRETAILDVSIENDEGYDATQMAIISGERLTSAIEQKARWIDQQTRTDIIEEVRGYIAARGNGGNGHKRLPHRIAIDDRGSENGRRLALVGGTSAPAWQVVIDMIDQQQYERQRSLSVHLFGS